MLGLGLATAFGLAPFVGLSTMEPLGGTTNEEALGGFKKSRQFAEEEGESHVGSERANSERQFGRGGSRKPIDSTTQPVQPSGPSSDHQHTRGTENPPGPSGPDPIGRSTKMSGAPPITARTGLGSERATETQPSEANNAPDSGETPAACKRGDRRCYRFRGPKGNFSTGTSKEPKT